MIRNELLTSGRQLLLFLALAALLAALIPLAGGQTRDMNFGEIFLPYFQVMSLLAALLFGLSAFAQENRQRSFDYLLSLPVSRNRILAIKTLSRLAGLLPLYLIALAVAKLIGTGASLVTPFSFSLLFLSLFFIGLTFSASSPHLAVNFSLSLALFLLFYSGLALITRAALLNSANSRLQELTPGPLEFIRKFLFFHPEGRDINSLIWLSPLLLLAACAGALAWRFKSFDPSRRRRFNQRLLGSLALLLTVSILPAYLLTGLAVETTLERSQVKLSSDHLLLFNRGREFQVARLGPEGLETIHTNPNGAFYFRGRPGGGPRVFATRADRLFRLDLRDFSLEEYRGPRLDQAQSGHLLAVHQDEQGFVMVESLTGGQDRGTSNFYRVDENGQRLLMNLNLAIDPKRDWIQYWGRGLLVYREGRLQVYAYPDLTELDFPAWR